MVRFFYQVDNRLPLLLNEISQSVTFEKPNSKALLENLIGEIFSIGTAEYDDDYDDTESDGNIELPLVIRNYATQNIIYKGAVVVPFYDANGPNKKKPRPLFLSPNLNDKNIENIIAAESILLKKDQPKSRSEKSGYKSRKSRKGGKRTKKYHK